MTSSRRARRRRRQARIARLARTEPRLDAWQRAVSAFADGFRNMSTVAAQIDWAVANLLASFGKAAAMSRPFNDDFGEHDEETLALGSLVGIRYWSMSTPFWDDERRPVVRLSGARGQWHPGENIAQCHNGIFAGHSPDKIPDRSCGCGFWAYWKPDVFGGSSYVSGAEVAGMIQGWGRYRAGIKGFRCAKAKIVALCVSTPQALRRTEEWRVYAERALAAEYKVPVYTEISTMLKAFPPSRQPQEPVPAVERGIHPGGLVYTPGLPTAAATVHCPCGTQWGLAPGSAVKCSCGRGWTFDGYRQPVMHDLITGRQAMKQLGIGESGGSP